MKDQSKTAGKTAGLEPYLSPLAVWALSVGSAIGWGSLVVTGKDYLLQAGPLGSILGLLIGLVMMLVLAVSLPVPFLGRTAIGWIVDTTTVGATILYGFASMAVFKASGAEGCKKNRILSGVCIVIMIAFMTFTLMPGLFADHTIETESYVLLIAWSMLGLLFFNRVIRKDHARNFGKAVIVWIVLLAFIVMMALTLASRVNEARENAVIDEIHSYMNRTADSETLAMDEETFLSAQRQRLLNADNASVLVILGLFGLPFAVLQINYHSMRKWEKKAVEEQAGGSGFMQFGLIRDGETVMQIERPRARCYRTLAELNGNLCFIDSVNMLHFDEFMAELQRLGVSNALYMDMGAGWNYSWYRNAAGRVVTLFGLPVPWSHNWVVFRK